jgi:hypothetical protein
MQQTILAQPIASTELDLQGEQLSKEELESVLRGIPERTPLNQHHDMSLPTLGFAFNHRIIQHPKDPEHFILVCDITYDDALGSPDLNGFSYSTISKLFSNSKTPDFEIYLPFPHYKDQSLLQKFLQTENEVAIGKWTKKAANPWLIALVVIAIRPFWEDTYKELLADKIRKLLRSIKSIWPDGISINVMFEIPFDAYTPKPSALLFPPTGSGISGIVITRKAVDFALDYCQTDYVLTGKCISKLRIKYIESSSTFEVIGTEYNTGEYIPGPSSTDNITSNDA